MSAQSLGCDIPLSGRFLDGSDHRPSGEEADRHARYIALVDVNSFYVSCERMIDPKLNGKPVVVLSNNDGCAITLSPEAKALGIEMGEPWFKLAPTAARRGLIARSSNYELYGNLSSRVMELINRHSAWVEVYSIDEAFAGVRGSFQEITAWAEHLRSEILRLTGLPVCVGVARTKTLAKLANRWAKKRPAFSGVCHWEAVPESHRETLMHRLPVDEIWGIAGRLRRRLEAFSITTVADLRDADPVRIRKAFSVVVMRTVLELGGAPCIPMEEDRELKHQLIFSRSFSTPVTTVEVMNQVLGLYAQRAAARLATHQKQAKQLQAWAMTSYYNPREPHSAVVNVALPSPTADPLVLTRAAHALLEKLRPGARYARAGIVLTDLYDTGRAPVFDLFRDPHEDREIGPLIQQVKDKTGTTALGLGRAGLRTPAAWEMKREMRSPRATTHWDELLLARA